MKSFRKILLFVLTLVMAVMYSGIRVKAEAAYSVADVSGGSVDTLAEFDNYYYANNYYYVVADEYDDLVLYEGDRVLKMEYGIVEFLTDENCTMNIEYRSAINNIDSSINGCYGKDAAYLYTDVSTDTVYFRMSGDIGQVEKDKVILHPFGLLDVRVSSYSNIDGELNHKIKTQLELDYYSLVLPIDKEFGLLKEGQDYYSYDGHYFYDDFRTMIDDYRNGTYESALNSEDPYYNYYQYLPHRSLTDYDCEEVENYFYDVLKIRGKLDHYEDQAQDGANDVVNRSQYYDELRSFFGYQNIYGVNALMMLSVSINESAYGKSYRSYAGNNLFSNIAYDSDRERRFDRYDSVRDSVYAYAKYYISDRYCNYRSPLYYGSCFGNKETGMNVCYSNDPYWGEKAASNYYRLDGILGYRDRDNYAVGIVKGGGNISFYSDEGLNRLLYRMSGVDDMALIILEDRGDVYKVQTDPSFSDEYIYDFEKCTAYIDKDLVDFLIGAENIHGNDLVSITYEGNGGLYDGKEKMEILFLKGKMPVIIEPEYEGYDLTGYDLPIERAQEEKTYTAQYRKIKDIEVSAGLKKTLELGRFFDLRDTFLNITYENGQKERQPLDSDMLHGVDIYENGKQSLEIDYNGVSRNVDVDVSRDLSELSRRVDDLIEKNISSYRKNGKFSSDEVKEIKRDLQKLDYLYDIEMVRDLDAMLLETDRDRFAYHIDDNRFDLEVSGLCLSLPDAGNSTLFKPFRDTYYVHVKEVSGRELSTLKDIAGSYGFEVIDQLNVSYSLNLKKVEAEGAVVLSVKLPDKETDRIYSVYRLDDNGDVVKCKTTQTDSRIQFLTKRSGSFVIMARDSVNVYDIKDMDENMTQDNMDPDNQAEFLYGMGLLAVCLIGSIAILYYQILNRKEEKIWKDFKRSLQRADTVPEEKLKS